MIETITHATNSLPSGKTEISIPKKDLNEEDQSFYSSIKPELNALARNPLRGTIVTILEFSKTH